ncbi:MAG: 4'-phosphopantetheinyl transferase family protein [Gaiellaceae bacterium]
MAAPGGLPRSGEADLWVFRPSSDGARTAAVHLSEEELERGARLTRHEHRDRFAAVRGTLRTVLARYLDMAPGEIPIVYGPQGKPHLPLELDSPVSFNLSHSGALAAIAVTRTMRLGVDIELRVPRPRLPVLAEALLAPEERHWYDRLAPSRRTRGFFDLWSAKEACSKLIGRGLTMPLSSITLESPAAELSRVNVDHVAAPAAPCYVRRLPVGSPYSGALAIELAPVSDPLPAMSAAAPHRI